MKKKRPESTRLVSTLRSRRKRSVEENRTTVIRPPVCQLRQYLLGETKRDRLRSPCQYTRYSAHAPFSVANDYSQHPAKVGREFVDTLLVQR